MKPLHMLMALSFSAFWGANFVAIKMSLESFSPFFQQGLRFFFVSFPLIFFVPRPRHSWKAIFKFSLFLWVFQLSFITLGLNYGVPAGMFSLLLQTKAIVVIILSTLFYHYRPCLSEIVGVILSLTGVAMIAHSIMEEETSAAYLFIIPAVLSVSYASLAFKNDNASNPFSITIWCAFIAMIPMFLMSLAVEGPSQALHSLETFTWRSLFALFYTVICATLIATSFYVFLLKRYGPERMIPFNLLIPVFGTFTSYKQAIEIKPDEPLIHLAYAQTLIEKNQPKMDKEAIHELRNVLKDEEENPFAWRLLAIAYGRGGNLGMSSLALAEEALANDKPKIALTQLKRAQYHLKGGPDTLRAADIQSLAERLVKEKE